ncbi:MAG: hypothetical protein IJU14_05615 [Clostridia bacterium]|nr:hypothetical protein [Clostridia bacterium]
MKKKFLIGIDTETCNGLVDDKGKLDLSQSLVYDIGWQVVDRKGKIYRKRSYVVAEIFLDKELMAGAYYSDKIPQYWEDIKNGKRFLKTFMNIRKIFLSDRKYFRIEKVFAHNAYFDYNALNNTIRLLTGSEYRYFMPYCVEWWDTLKMARDVFSKNKNYSAYCQKNGYLTAHKHPQNRLTAEILWKYISNNPDFEESHTGLEDVEIETEIMAYCLRTRKKIRKTLFNKRV